MNKYVIAAPSFMVELNKKFASLMRNRSIQQQVIKDAIDYSEDMTEDEVLERAFNEIYPAWMEDLERRGTFEDNGLVVYRGISAEGPEDIDKDKVGIYWTWDQGKADNYSGINTELPLQILTALVSIDDIDLKETFVKLVWPGYDFDESEREVTLKSGRKVKLLDNPDQHAKATLIAALKKIL